MHGCVHISTSVWAGAGAHVYTWVEREIGKKESSFITLHLLFSKWGLSLNSELADWLIRKPPDSICLHSLPLELLRSSMWPFDLGTGVLNSVSCLQDLHWDISQTLRYFYLDRKHNELILHSYSTYSKNN